MSTVPQSLKPQQDPTLTIPQLPLHTMYQLTIPQLTGLPILLPHQ